MAAEPHQPFCELILLDAYFYKLEGKNEKCLIKKKVVWHTRISPLYLPWFCVIRGGFPTESAKPCHGRQQELGKWHQIVDLK